MNPYQYIRDATDNHESLLALCCGIGRELYDLNTQDVVAVDIMPQYLNEVKRKYPHVHTIEADVRDYIKKCDTKSVDIISLLDGIEHMNKKDGLKVLKECKRVARKKILLFTPEGFVKNEPHNAWDIEGGDKYQVHKSGWTQEELENLGFTLIKKAEDISVHSEPYVALMMEYHV